MKQFISDSSNFETFTAVTLKLQVVNFGMFFHVMQTIHFMHVCCINIHFVLHRSMVHFNFYFLYILGGSDRGEPIGS